jgi:hypothetical protein
MGHLCGKLFFRFHVGNVYSFPCIVQAKSRTALDISKLGTKASPLCSTSRNDNVVLDKSLFIHFPFLGHDDMRVDYIFRRTKPSHFIN